MVSERMRSFSGSACIRLCWMHTAVMPFIPVRLYLPRFVLDDVRCFHRSVIGQVSGISTVSWNSTECLVRPNAELLLNACS